MGLSELANDTGLIELADSAGSVLERFGGWLEQPTDRKPFLSAIVRTGEAVAAASALQVVSTGCAILGTKGKPLYNSDELYARFPKGTPEFKPLSRSPMVFISRGFLDPDYHEKEGRPWYGSKDGVEKYIVPADIMNYDVLSKQGRCRVYVIFEEATERIVGFSAYYRAHYTKHAIRSTTAFDINLKGGEPKQETLPEGCVYKRLKKMPAEFFVRHNLVR